MVGRENFEVLSTSDDMHGVDLEIQRHGDKFPKEKPSHFCADHVPLKRGMLICFFSVGLVALAGATAHWSAAPRGTRSGAGSVASSVVREWESEDTVAKNHDLSSGPKGHLATLLGTDRAFDPNPMTGAEPSDFLDTRQTGGGALVEAAGPKAVAEPGTARTLGTTAKAGKAGAVKAGAIKAGAIGAVALGAGALGAGAVTAGTITAGAVAAKHAKDVAIGVGVGVGVGVPVVLGLGLGLGLGLHPASVLPTLVPLAPLALPFAGGGSSSATYHDPGAGGGYEPARAEPAGADAAGANPTGEDPAEANPVPHAS